MRNIDWYLDTARERIKLKSDHELSHWLGRSRGTVTQWRTRRNWPTGPMMVRLAIACGVDPEIALAELGAWREPEVQAWRSMVERLGKTAAALVLAFILSMTWPGNGGSAMAGTMVEHAAIHVPDGIHYATLALRWMRRNLRLLKGFLLQRHNHMVLVPA